MDSWSLAFFTGLFGSLHCLGMCGPLAFSVGSSSHQAFNVFIDKLSYQLGRVISYSFLGLIAGLLGRQFWLWGAQQYLAVISGLLIVGAAVVRLGKFGGRWFSPGNSRFFNRFLAWAVNSRQGHLLVGILNGFLPCGFVYIALAGAINVNAVGDGVVYMAMFGLGTLPLMLVAALSINKISPLFRRKAARAVPVFMLFLGAWFIFRGLNLGVDYLSPQLRKSGPVECGPTH